MGINIIKFPFSKVKAYVWSVFLGQNRENRGPYMRAAVYLLDEHG